MSQLRVLLAEDHTLVRSGIRALLEEIEGVGVVAEVGDGRDAMEYVNDHAVDVVLMDIAMPGLNGLEATARIAKKHPRVRILMLSMHADEEYVGQALRAGATGYLLKDASRAEFELALNSVARGETYLSPQVSKAVVEGYVHPDFAQSPLERLTPRQREILQLIAEGYTTKSIAQRLSIKVKTVEAHRSQLMDRLDIHDIAGLVRFAVRQGVIHAG